VAFKRRGMGTLSVERLAAAAVLLACIPLGREVDAVVTVAVIAGVLWGLIALESVRHAEARNEIRHAGHTHD
jgi:hypothetical protein